MTRVAGHCLPFVIALRAVTPAASQTPAPYPAPGAERFAPGELIERVVSAADSTQSYALYLPSRYRPDTRWPILFIMDPRGRALLPLRLIQRAAERHGYVVMSSYNTASDGPMQPNVDAMEAMLADAQRSLSIDTRRFYLMGLSGTARAAWGFGDQLQGHVAGLIGFGAGLPVHVTVPPTVLSDSSSRFAFFGGAGTTDFNYEEVRALEATLARFGLVHRMEYYDGAHAWPPEQVMAHALAWMELQAMKRGLVPRENAKIDSAFVAAVREARVLEGAGQPFEAQRQYGLIVEAYRDIHDISEPQARFNELGKSEVVHRTAEQLEDAARQHDAYLSRLREFFDRFRQSTGRHDLEKSLNQLRIAELKRAAANTTNPIAALAAQRLLEQVFVFTSFYEPRAYLAKGDAARALSLLAIAEAIKPGDPNICYNRAWALTQIGRIADALLAVDCLVRAGRTDPGRLEADSNLKVLRNNPGFRAIISRLREQEMSQPPDAPP